MNARSLLGILTIGLFLLTLWLIAGSVLATEPVTPEQSTATVSGTIRHQVNPVSNVEVTIKWDSGFDHATTGPDGTYSFGSVPTGGPVTLEVRPPVELRLAYRNWRSDPLVGNLVKDFNLESGYLLQGEYRTPDSAQYTGFPPGIVAVGSIPPSGEYYGPAMDSNGNLALVLPPGFYALTYAPEMAPYFMPPTVVDLQSADVLGKVITLLDRPEPIPTAPPVASLITVGEPDAAGLATVTGAAGAVPPSVGVIAANLNAFTVDVTASDANGSFTAELYAPPGSSLLIKYDPTGSVLSDLWTQANDFTQGPLDFVVGDHPSLPGTMLYVGPDHPGSEISLAFDSASVLASISPRGWAGVWLTGTLQMAASGLPDQAVAPGETVTLTTHMRVTSPDVTCTLPLTFTVDTPVMLHSLFGVDGRANPGNEDFAAQLFTPTGLPIDGGSGDATKAAEISFDAWTCGSEHAFQSTATATFTVPVDLPEGIYLPRLLLQNNGVPLSTQLPLVISWYYSPGMVFLPPLTVGSPAPPRLPLILLSDYPVNGHRGVQAREDQGQYRMETWVVFPADQAVIPRMEARTGQPLRYQLEPGSNWLSLTDRRLPSPLRVPFAFPSGTLVVEVVKPDGNVDRLGPTPIRQSSVRTPTTPGGEQIGRRTGTLGDVYHLVTLNETFAYSFDQYGAHTIHMFGEVDDIYGNSYLTESTYDIIVAQVLDLDPAQLPTTPYKQGDAFAPGLHVFPPVPAEVTVQLVHMPYSDPTQAITMTITGQANRFGYFQPPVGTQMRLETPGEFRVDITAVYTDADGTLWAGVMTWGNVVEGANSMIEAHGRRGMDYNDPTIDDMPAWFVVDDLPPKKIGPEVYYPYFSGDVHWGREERAPGDSIQPAITVKDLTGANQTIYNFMRANVDRSTIEFRPPPSEDPSLENLEKRIAVGEAPLFITTQGKKDPSMYPEAINVLAYWYGTSERPGVRVREVVSQDRLGVGYWGFDDTYGYQIGQPATGDQQGDLKWEFGGAVFRVISETNPVNEYGIYSSLWVLLPHNDPVGTRVTPPFQDATGASINGGPIMTITVQGEEQEIDMLFLPQGVRPGDVLEVGDVVAFSGHVGPPLDSRVAVTITTPSGAVHTGIWHANKIGWLYDPTFDFEVYEPGRWTVDVAVLHDRPYVGNGVTPVSHNTGTVLGTSGQHAFYVVEPDSPELNVSAPQPGYITWPKGEIEPISIRGYAPDGATNVYYTIYDKGTVMGQGSVVPAANGAFVVTYDAETLHNNFPYLSLTAHEGNWEGLADEVAINLLAVGAGEPRAASVTLIGEEVFIRSGDRDRYTVYLPLIVK